MWAIGNGPMGKCDCHTQSPWTSWWNTMKIMAKKPRMSPVAYRISAVKVAGCDATRMTDPQSHCIEQEVSMLLASEERTKCVARSEIIRWKHYRCCTRKVETWFVAERSKAKGRECWNKEPGSLALDPVNRTLTRGGEINANDRDRNIAEVRPWFLKEEICGLLLGSCDTYLVRRNQRIHIVSLASPLRIVCFSHQSPHTII